MEVVRCYSRAYSADPLREWPLRSLDVSQCLFTGNISECVNTEAIVHLNVEHTEGLTGVGEFRSKRRASVKVLGRSSRLGSTSW